MTGSELQKLRRRTGLTLLAFGACLGVGGKGKSVKREMRRLEGLADQPIPAALVPAAEAIAAKLAQLEAEGWE